MFLIACTEPEATQQRTPPPEKLGASVEVSGGTITGNVREDGLYEYLGIPYAAPPVGDLRWQPPGAVIGWEGTRDATKRGLPCVQPGSLSAFYDRSYLETSEDCLTLNVWTRADTVAQGLPVMVWIHGGALVMGSGRDYDGAPLTERGVVLVTINYRLGPFGFYAHPELSAENSAGASGNQGFRDQIAALQWVRDNIAAFGGNPDNVTIFGESAGSWSMSVMQASPMARGLFLYHCFYQALELAKNRKPDILILNSYWYKYYATEVAHGGNPINFSTLPKSSPNPMSPSISM